MEAFCCIFGIEIEVKIKPSKNYTQNLNSSRKHPLAFEEHCYDSFYEEKNSINGDCND